MKKEKKRDKGFRTLLGGGGGRKKIVRIDEFNFLGRDLLIVVSDVREKPELSPAIIPVIR